MKKLQKRLITFMIISMIEFVFIGMLGITILNLNNAINIQSETITELQR